MSRKQTNLTTGNITKALFSMALPLMVVNLINALYALVDTFWIGQIDQLQVGAVNLVTRITNCGNAFATGLAAGGLALISRSLGENKPDKANHLATILIELCIFLGVIIGAFCIIFANELLHWIDTPTDIYNGSYWYLIGLSADFLFLFIITIFQAIRQANGDSKTGIKINLIAAVLNSVLDPLMIFGLNLSLFGAALATTLSKALTCIFVLYSLVHDKYSTHIDFIKYKPNFSLLKEITLISIPASTGSFMSEFGFVMMNKSITQYGSLILSAYGIGSKIAGLFYIPLNAVGTALTPFIGQNLGAQNYERTKQCYKEAMRLAIYLSIAITVIGIPLAKPLTSLFIKNASSTLIYESYHYAVYSLSTALFMGWFNNLMAVYNGSGNTHISLIINIMRLWIIRMPMIYAFEKLTTLNQTGIWLSMCLSNLVICTIAQLWYKYKFVKDLDNKIAC